MFSESKLSCSFFTIAIILLLGGIPCWAVGAIRPKYYNSEFLYSIPLFPIKANDTLTPWSFLSDDDQDSNELTFPISSSDFPKKHLNKNINIHILHNLWGLKMAVSFLKNSYNYNTFYYNHNINHDEFFNRTVFPGNLPSSLRKYGGYRIKCPFSTLITQENQIEPRCSREIGSFMNLQGPFEDLIIGNIKVENNDKISMIFSELNALPYDFVFTPQMFIGFWKKSDANKLIISGTVLTISGIVVLVLSIIFFFVCFPGNDEGTDRN